MMRYFAFFLSAALSLLLPVVSVSAKEPPADPRLLFRPLPGPQADGAVLLPNQWSLRPTGKQVEVGNFPVQVILHPQGDWAVVLHSGYGPHEVVVVDLKTAGILSRVTLPKTFYGLCFTPDGKRLLVSGGADDVVYQFDFADGRLSNQQVIAFSHDKTALVTAGLACSHDGKWLFAACCLGDRLMILPLPHAEKQQAIAMPAGSHPYTGLPAKKTERLYVSLWGKSSVAVVDRTTEKIEATWPTASHPTEMALSPDEDLLYVACADSNTVSVIETQSGRQIEVITTSLYPQAPHGSTPNSLALAPNGKTLWVANADANNLAVIDVSQRGKSRSLGFIPVGWYPTSVRMSAKADRILVANGKGLKSKANPHGPNSPLRMEKGNAKEEYIGGLFPGALSIIATPAPGEMPSLSKAAYACSPLRAAGTMYPWSAPAGGAREPNNPIPAKVGEASPIKHCIYIIKENRTYDQVFGDMREGNGDAALCIFPERVTPNHHALARQFVLLDNFYVDGEVSANGHEWSTAAYATDYVEKVWPLVYRHGDVHGKRALPGFQYPAEGATPIAIPASGYLWDRCREAGVSLSQLRRVHRKWPAAGQSGACPGQGPGRTLRSLVSEFRPGVQ